MPTSSGSGSSTPIAPASRDQSLSRVTSKDHGRTPIDASQALPHYDWAALSNRYEDSMRECGREEAKLMTDFDKLMQVCLPTRESA